MEIKAIIDGMSLDKFLHGFPAKDITKVRDYFPSLKVFFQKYEIIDYAVNEFRTGEAIVGDLINDIMNHWDNVSAYYNKLECIIPTALFNNYIEKERFLDDELIKQLNFKVHEEVSKETLRRIKKPYTERKERLTVSDVFNEELKLTELYNAQRMTEEKKIISQYEEKKIDEKLKNNLIRSLQFRHRPFITLEELKKVDEEYRECKAEQELPENIKEGKITKFIGYLPDDSRENRLEALKNLDMRLSRGWWRDLIFALRIKQNSQDFIETLSHIHKYDPFSPIKKIIEGIADKYKFELFVVQSQK